MQMTRANFKFLLEKQSNQIQDMENCFFLERIGIHNFKLYDHHHDDETC